MKRAALVIVLACAVAWSSVVLAQVLYGTIVGNVTDTSGAAVPGATVTVTNVLTNLSQEFITSETGLFTARNLQAGNYSVKVELSGFKTVTRTGVELSASNVIRVDAKLEIGEVTETVTVQGLGEGVLQTDKAEVSTEMASKEITELPGNLYRNYQSTMDLVPGVMPTQFQNSSFSLPQRSLTTNVGGVSRNSNNTRLDGVSNMIPFYPHQTLYIPPQESVQSVNVSTNSFDAEQGIAGGAAISVQTKSGTNDFRGVGFGYLTNSAFSAKNFFTPAGQNVPKKIISMYGGTFGGPLVKDKLFFFTSYEAMRHRENYAVFQTVPTMPMRQGDFSATGTKLYDPTTGNPDGSGRSQFAGGAIPGARISPMAKTILALVPEPNQPGFVNNYYTSAPFVFDRDNFDVKVDWVKSSSTTIWAKYSVMNALLTAQASLGAAGGPGLGDGGSGVSRNRNQIASVGATKTFSSTFLVDGVVGFSRYRNAVTPDDYGENYGLETLGIPGTNGPDIRQSGMPYFAITGYTAYGVADAWNPCNRVNNSYIASGNSSWMRGTHDIRFGVDLDRRQINDWQPPTGGAGTGPRGRFNYSGAVTALKGGTSPNRYNSMADFLLGLPVLAGKTLVNQAPIRETVMGLYLRDRWQATKNFTLTLGIRWEYYSVPTRDHKGISRYDPNDNMVYIGGVGNVPMSNGIEFSKKLFAPRLGVAYRIGDKSVIRAGYGITFDPFSVGRAMRSGYPNTIELTKEGANSFQPFASSIYEGIPEITFPDTSSGIVPMPLRVNESYLPEGLFRRGYVQSWNLIYERKLPFSLVGSVGYVATRSIRQRTGLERNVAAPGGGTAGRALYQKWGRTASTSEHAAWQTADYNSFQTTLDRRFTAGLYLKTTYTWGKAIAYNDDSNEDPLISYPDYWYRNRAVASHDRTHVFRQAWLYELPFGTGRKWIQEGFGGKLLSGWQVNGIFSSYSGTPFTVTASGASLNAPGNSQLADQVLTEVKKLSGIGLDQPFYDPLAFRPVTEVRFGNVGRNSLRGPGVVNMDMVMFRSFRIREDMQLQFRAECFNVTNTPHFANPGANASNMKLNTDGTLASAGSFMAITTAAADQRNFRFGLRFSF